MTQAKTVTAKKRAWYAEGLRFGCVQCGRCCGGAPGYVWLDQEELKAIAKHVGLPAKEFRRIYVRRLWRKMTLKERGNYDCVMLDAAGRCTVYPVRPLQCRTWPFWPVNLKSRKSWREARRRCPGIGNGPVYSFEQIEAKRMEMEL